jgi:hypothetical protein
MRVRFRDIAQPVAFDGCEDLLDTLAAVTNGWQWQTADDGAAPVIAVTAVPHGWRIVSRWLPHGAVYDDRADILCALLADLTMAYVEDAPRLLCVHAGAAAMGTGDDAPLFVFPAETLAGKSTLATALALGGGRLYTDDVLPVDLQAGDARAIGLSPRPRLPLPATLPPSLRRDIEGRITLANPRFAYVAPGPDRLAPLGERRAIAGFVRLERGAGRAELAAEPRGEIMMLLLRQNFGARPPAAEMVARFAALTATAACWRLRYDDVGEAVALLMAQAQASRQDQVAS